MVSVLEWAVKVSRIGVRRRLPEGHAMTPLAVRLLRGLGRIVENRHKSGERLVDLVSRGNGLAQRLKRSVGGSVNVVPVGRVQWADRRLSLVPGRFVVGDALCSGSQVTLGGEGLNVGYDGLER